MDPLVKASIRKVYGSLTDNLVKKLKTPPKRLYLRVNTYRISVEELIESLEKRGLKPHRDRYVEEAIYFEVDGPYKVDALPKFIYVDRFAAESIMIGANLYRPGVRKFSQFEAGDEVTVFSPNNEPIAIVKTVVSSRDLLRMKKGLVGLNVLSKFRAPPIRELPEYIKGLIYPQSLPAMVVSKILNVSPGELVVDLNAAPGGKTSHIVQLTKGSARLISIDRGLKKALLIKDNVDRLLLNLNLVIIPMDSRFCDQSLYGLTGVVDKVVVDPPCSALGVRPKTYFDKTWRDVVDLREYQFQFLKVANRLVKNGGLIVYSTCTVTFDENEYNTQRAVEELDLETIDLGELPYSERVFFDNIVAYRYSPLTNDMPGYYIALFRKKN